MEKKECILEKVTEAEWSSTDLPPAGKGKEGSTGVTEAGSMES